MKIKVKMNNKKGFFNANAIYEDGKITILKGSKIKAAQESSFKRAKQVVSCRENKKLIKDNILLDDIEFKSPSTAAQLVTDSSTNGYESWKCVETGKTLKEYHQSIEKEG